MFSQILEELIEGVLADGVITDKERAILHRRALAEGINPDELDIVLDGRLAKMRKVGNPTSQVADNERKSQAIGDEMGNSYSSGRKESHHPAQELQRQLNELDQEYAEKIMMAKKSTEKYRLDDEKQKRKFQLISTFLIPNAKDELVELMIMAQGFASATGPTVESNEQSEENYSLAYWKLFGNCIQKVKYSFADDTSFAPFYAFYEQEDKRSKNLFNKIKKFF